MNLQSVGIEPTLLRTRALSVRLNRSAKTANAGKRWPGRPTDVVDKSAQHSDVTSWRNGNASDSRPEDWGFDSLWGHSPLFCFVLLFLVCFLLVLLVYVCRLFRFVTVLHKIHVHVGQASTLTTQMLKNCLTLLSVLVRTPVSTCSLVWVSSQQKKEKGYFHAGIWTRVLWVKTTYPNQLDYAEGDVDVSAHSFLPTAVSV